MSHIQALNRKTEWKQFEDIIDKKSHGSIHSERNTSGVLGYQ